MAECTPNFRAAYDAAETTPRSSRCPPTTTGLPFSDGSNNSSTETKKASISTWKMVREIGPSADRVIIGRIGRLAGLAEVYRQRALGLGSGSADAIASLSGSARLPCPASPTKLTSWTPPPTPPTPYLGLLESMFWRKNL